MPSLLPPLLRSVETVGTTATIITTTSSIRGVICRRGGRLDRRNPFSCSPSLCLMVLMKERIPGGSASMLHLLSLYNNNIIVLGYLLFPSQTVDSSIQFKYILYSSIRSKVRR